MTGYCTECGVTTAGTDEEHLKEAHLFGPTGARRAVDAPKKRKPASVDQACIDLAEHFLSDVSGHSPEDVTELAETLQRLCEETCSAIEDGKHFARRSAK